MSSTKKIDIMVGQIRKKLFLPVLVRALESKKSTPMLYDKTALDIVERVNFDFTKLISSTTELSRIASIVRYTCFDRLIKDFLRRYPDATVVNIGCGLDTTYERVDNGLVQWYDIDLTDIINLRKLFMNETKNRKFIAGSFLENDWYKNLGFPEHVLFIAGGVFHYYEEKVIRTFFIKLSLMFQTCELLFDVTSPLGVRVTNKVLQKAKIDDKSFLKWGLKNTDSILSWSPRLRILGKYHIYKQRGITMNLKNRILGWFSDALSIQYILHLQIKFDYNHLKSHVVSLRNN
jgi:O-methyltransferase involved in polyketide biosynthesis